MSNYYDKLTALAAKKEKLLAKETQLIHQRKTEIANLSERCELLTCSDELLTGLFLELKKFMLEKDYRLQEWETAGGRFLKSTKNKLADRKAAQTIIGAESASL